MKSDRPPEALQCQSIHKEHGKEAFKQNFRLPDGNIDSWFLFQSSDKPVIIFPLTEKDEVVVLEHFRYGANSFVLEVPGGGIEGDFVEWSKISISAKIQNAKRELEEETGYTSNQFVEVGPKTWFDPASSRVSFLPMFAQNCFKKGQPHAEPTEIFKGEPILIPLKKWVDMIRQNKICDSKTIAITFMALCYLNKLNRI
jgi:8-oxo-dGTP pyrophosphatase MutT (NUDIX family)